MSATLSDAAVIVPAFAVPSPAAPKTRSRAAVTLARLLHRLSRRLCPPAADGPSPCHPGETLRWSPVVKGLLWCPACGDMMLPDNIVAGGVTGNPANPRNEAS